MSMTPRLYSISGLAVELRKDRRTVAAKLRAIQPDGHLPGGHSGWFLTTALRAFGERNGLAGEEVPDLIACTLESRLANPKIITGRKARLVSIEEAATMLETSCETVMVW